MKTFDDSINSLKQLQLKFLVAMQEISQHDSELAQNLLFANSSDIKRFADLPRSDLVAALGAMSLPILFVAHPESRPRNVSHMQKFVEDVSCFDSLNIDSVLPSLGTVSKH
ncbi:hypothetical protein [Motilimonas eburnea]|uniref:hypothetical protein n=1 Tax=Motilimonas eburnea TaxID=1737488 RepID=UPI001E2E725D|nr:hypothetical protein [Motilimonas eburnea]MCE2571778.1 hypothetical protein [Motilimonas eburnea]